MSAADGAEGEEEPMAGDRQYPRGFPFDREPYPVEDLSPEQQEMLGRLGAEAHAAGNASVALNPSDPAFFMLLDKFVSHPVVHDQRCYICRDPEFAQMGMPLCTPCPACLRRQETCGACEGQGGVNGEPCSDCLTSGLTGSMGHIAADDDTCTVCGTQHGPWDYAEDGTITGLSAERNAELRALRDGTGQPRKRG